MAILIYFLPRVHIILVYFSKLWSKKGGYSILCFGRGIYSNFYMYKGIASAFDGSTIVFWSDLLESQVPMHMCIYISTVIIIWQEHSHHFENCYKQACLHSERQSTFLYPGSQVVLGSGSVSSQSSTTRMFICHSFGAWWDSRQHWSNGWILQQAEIHIYLRNLMSSPI